MSEVYINGLADLQKLLDNLPAKLERNVMRGALRVGAKVIAEDAKMRVSVVSGRLRNSIRVSTKVKGGNITASVFAGGKTKKTVTKTAEGGVKVTYLNPFYAPWVEFGTRPHHIGIKYAKSLVLRPNSRASSGFANRWMKGEVLVEGVDHPGAIPRPFMRPALDGQSQNAVVAAAEYIKNRLATKNGLDTADIEIEVKS